jgi:16S rRNA (guanine(527)-N(7))-methyltransferase RsmG
VFHVKHELDRAVADVAGVEPTEAARERLFAFERLLLTRAIPLGLIAESDRSDVRERHLLDCARAAAYVHGANVADLGSGAGLPGIVVAILRPDIRVYLVEAQRRRLAFLELAVDEVGLENAVPVGARVETLRDRFSGAVSRAFADPARSWRLAEPHLEDDGELVYFGGRTFDPATLPVGVGRAVVPPPPLLASSGPLVIMSRQ